MRTTGSSPSRHAVPSRCIHSPAALFQIVDGAQVVGAGMLRGLHDTKVAMIYAALGYWVIGISVSVAAVSITCAPVAVVRTSLTEMPRSLAVFP